MARIVVPLLVAAEISTVVFFLIVYGMFGRAAGVEGFPTISVFSPSPIVAIGVAFIGSSLLGAVLFFSIMWLTED